jgi:DNA-binding transcriptional MerR regulator
MRTLTRKEVLAKLKKEKLGISPRTFEYYQSQGLIPKPYNKTVGKKGRGVYGLYDARVIMGVKEICKLRDKGFSLNEISMVLRLKVADRLKAVLKTWGFSNFYLPEMREGWNPSEQEQREVLLKMGSSVADAERVVDSVVATDFFGGSLTKNLRWWHDEEAIETVALEFISTAAGDNIFGIWTSLNITLKEVESSENPIVKTALNSLAKKLLDKVQDLSTLQDKVRARLEELAQKHQKKTE